MSATSPYQPYLAEPQSASFASPPPARTVHNPYAYPPAHHRNPSAPSLYSQSPQIRPPPNQSLHGARDTLFDEYSASEEDLTLPRPHHAQPFGNNSFRQPHVPARTFDQLLESTSSLNISPQSSTSAISGHSKSSSLGRFVSPRLRSSQSFAANRPPMERPTPPRADFSGTTLVSTKSQDLPPVSAAASKALKKRSGLSTFFNTVLGSPRNKVEISAPSNPTHLCHVGFDNNTGEYTVSGVGRIQRLLRIRSFPSVSLQLQITHRKLTVAIGSASAMGASIARQRHNRR